MKSAFPGARNLAAAIVLTVGACVSAWAAAVVGETRVVAAPAAIPPVQDLDRLKAQFRRPDAIPFPSTNPYTPEKLQLGRDLFFDTRLSVDGTMSCASCHNPSFAYGDGLPKAMGRTTKSGARRSPSLLDSAWGELFMWDGRAASLEQQALGPIINPDEMALSLDQLLRRLQDIPGYRPLFDAAYPNAPVTAGTVADALATYERTVVSGPASFDAWVDGDEAAISAPAKRGFALFAGKAGCAECHADWTFSDYGFHDIGLADNDRGRGRLLPGVVKMQHAFKTPSLRDTARRGPYMHDGSLPTLEAVIAHYSDGGVDRSSRSPLIHPRNLSPSEQQDLVAFLKTLNSTPEPAGIPVLP
jgi:cytochrome c peroxidase